MLYLIIRMGVIVKMKKMNLLTFLVISIILSTYAYAGSVTRSFSQNELQPGDTLTVTLQIQDSVEVIEEFLPSQDWMISSISSNGFQLNPTTLNWIGFPTPLSGSITYNVLVPNQIGS